MLKAGRELDGAPRMLVTLATSAIPIVIVGGLLYAAFFVKAQAVVTDVRPPAIERRDSFLGVAAPDEKTIWAVGSNGKIVRSDDGGASWSAQLTPVQVNLQSISAWSPEKAVVVGNGGIVLRTEDGGKTWQEVDVPKSEVANKLLRVRTYENGLGWAVGELGRGPADQRFRPDLDTGLAGKGSGLERHLLPRRQRLAGRRIRPDDEVNRRWRDVGAPDQRGAVAV